MAAFNVTALSDLGYDEKTTFIDPMEPRYRPRSFSDSDFASRQGDFSDAAIQDKVAFFNSLDAYRNVNAVQSRLAAYWRTAAIGNGNLASSTLVSTSSSTRSSSFPTSTRTSIAIISTTKAATANTVSTISSKPLSSTARPSSTLRTTSTTRR